MPSIALDIELLKAKAPNALQDIVFCYDKNTEGFEKNKNTIFEKLPFLLQLGILKLYFYENGIDIDFNNLTIEELRDEITELIISHENTVKHYS